MFNGNTHTISRAEAVNSQIKARVWSKSTLSDCLDMMLELEDRVQENILCKEKKLNERENIFHQPLIKEIYDQYSNYAFERMLKEYSLSHELYAKKYIEENANDKILKFVVKNIADRVNNIVCITTNPMDGIKYTCN